MSEKITVDKGMYRDMLRSLKLYEPVVRHSNEWVDKIWELFGRSVRHGLEPTYEAVKELIEWRAAISDALGGGLYALMPERCRQLATMDPNESAQAREKRAMRERFIQAALTGSLANPSCDWNDEGHAEVAIRQADVLVKMLEAEK